MSTSLLHSPTRPRSGTGTRLEGSGWRTALLLVALATILARARFFGNPVVDADEEFYLLVGDRLLHGALPYVDIWDRKPVGLFVLFAAIRLLPGNGVLAYQLVAAAFAAGTAVVIALLARRIAPARCAIIAALTYAPFMGLSGGQGGQTPVFYNLPVALAVLLVLRRIAPAADAAPPRLPLRWLGAVVMLLLGLAIEIKPTAVFEGVFLGLALLWLAWRQDPRPLARAVDAGVWIAVALLPTVLAGLAYLALGHGDAFAYATLGSIFSRGGIGAKETIHNLGHALGRLAPLVVGVLVAEWLLRHDVPRRDPTAARAHAFLAGWAAAAVSGFAIFGTYFNHYVLPLLPPLAVLAAPAFGIRARRVGPVLAAVLLVGGTTWYLLYANKLERRKDGAAYAYALADRIRPLVGPKRCLFVFYGEPIYYHLTGSCLPSRWPFPFHLSLTREATALGVDPAAEMRRIMSSRPAAVVYTVSEDAEVNPVTRAILVDALHRDYRLVYAHRHPVRDGDIDQLWALKS